MSRWREHPAQVERELKALDHSTFGISYGDELLRRVLASLDTHVSDLKWPEMNEPMKSFSALIALGSEPIASSPLPGKIARILFGNTNLVFDVAARLDGAPNPQAAFIGSYPAYEPDEDKRETFIDFLARSPGCVAVFDDIQAFDPWAINQTSLICEAGYLKNSYTEAPAQEIIVIATLRVGLPSSRELESFVRMTLSADGTPIDWHDGRLTLSSFRYTVSSWIEKQFPKHFSPSIRSRFDLDTPLVEHLWRRYMNAYEEGEPEMPLLEVLDHAAAPWDDNSVTPPTAPISREWVPDVKDVLPLDYPKRQFHAFISYRTRRDEIAAKWLDGMLSKQGYTTWLDTKSLMVGDQPEEKVKADLIKELVLAVRASHCTIAFAMGIERFKLPTGMTEQVALQSGLAMWSQEFGFLVKWNWQKLELDESSEVLVLDRTTKKAYVLRGSISRESFRIRSIQFDDQILEVVLEYLSDLGIEPSQANDTS